MSDESLRQDFDGCFTLYKIFVKQYSANKIKSLDIAEASTNNASGNKSVTFPPEGLYLDSNEWYALSKNETYKTLNRHRNTNGGNNPTKSVGQTDSGGGGTNGTCKS